VIPDGRRAAKSSLGDVQQLSQRQIDH
jgi:hypothetical protein